MVPCAPCSPDSRGLPCRSTSTVPAHTVRTARALNSDGGSNHSQHQADLQSSSPSPPKIPNSTFPPQNPQTQNKQYNSSNNKNNSNNQSGEKNPKQTKERVSIELSFIQKHLSGKKKVGTEADWGQPVISGKESVELYLLSLLKHLLTPCVFSVTYTKKGSREVLENMHLYILNFQFSPETLSSRGIKILE